MVGTLREFLTQYADILIEQVKKITPLYSPEKERKEDVEKLNGLLRKPFPKQKDAVLSLVEGFRNGRNALFLTAEMGTGKTMMGICTAYLALPENSRTIILCPSHLVQKWIREIKITIPGARVFDIGEWSITEIMALRGTKPQGREFYVLGKEKAKLSYVKQYNAFWVQDNLKRAICPKCGSELHLKRQKRKIRCDGAIERRYTNQDGEVTVVMKPCDEIFWQADNSKLRRVAVAEIIKRKFPKGFFDLFIADEVHQYKSGDSAQGNAFAFLASKSKRTLCLTGTLMGGYASNLFYLLWRLVPGDMIRKLSLPAEVSLSTKERLFINRYGVVETVLRRRKVEDEELGIASISRKSSQTKVREKEKPGISPMIFTDMLLERSVFLRLSDVAENLPPYEEHVVNVEMDPEQAMAYSALEGDLLDAVKNALQQGSMRLLGAMLQSLFAYPDGTRRGEQIFDPATGKLIAEAPALEINPLPKEEKLLEIVKSEVSEGRKCLVYVEHTGTRDLIPDLEAVLREEGFRVASLRSHTVKVGEREAWIENELKHRDIDVLICNPRLVETGLDLIAFPTVIFFQTGYSVFTLRQASRRSWRIGQELPVRVYYLAYEGTIQEKALALMANKMQVALMVEGDLSDKGLTALADGESSIIVELAKAVIENSRLDAQSEWLNYKKTQMAVDAEIGRSGRIEETTTVTISDGRRSEKICFTSVFRGYIFPRKGYAVAVVDRKHRFIFKQGQILYGGKVVGWYSRSGEGEIAGKPIRIVKMRKDSRWALFEMRRAA